MALNDAMPFTAATGHLLLGPVGTAKPTIANINTYMAAPSTATITGMKNIGHTNLDTGFVNDGTDATSEVRGSYQNRNLRVVTTEPATEFVAVESLQVTDAEVLAKFYGGGTVTAGEFAVPDSSTPVEQAMLLIRQDGTRNVGEWFEKVAIERNGQITWPNDSFALVPLKFTALKVTGKPIKVIISSEIVVPA